MLRMLLLTFFVSLAAFMLLSVSPIDPLQANIGQAALGSMSQEQIGKLQAYWGVGEPRRSAFSPGQEISSGAIWEYLFCTASRWRRSSV